MWIDWKTNNEILPVQLRPHPHEFELDGARKSAPGPA
jgi:hypothetical protein